MAMMDARSFEARYVASEDPWGYLTSPYEQEKYADTLRACGPGPFAHALELGGSIGVFSALLAPRCEQLETIDLAPTAVAAARKRLARFPQATARVGTIPDDLPDGTFDLVLASEVLYYLPTDGLAPTLAALHKRMISGARLVAVHWTPAGPERPFDADSVHGALRACDWLQSVESARRSDYLLDVLVCP
jgi:protein-L-isoaspartate O-methyltransferase